MKKKLLIIEDDQSILEDFANIFQEEGYEVSTAINGKEGIESAKLFLPDLIICDLNMPKLNGFEVKKNLNDDENTFNIPFIYLTARTDIQDVQYAMELGADDYITKPIRVKKLIELVSNRLQRIETLKRSSSESLDRYITYSEDEKIILKAEGEHVLTMIMDIITIKALNDGSEVYLKNGKKSIVNKSLKSWEKMLPDKTFLRVHRSIIINTKFIEKIEPSFKGSYIAKLKYFPEPIYFSQRYSQKIRKLLLMK